MGKNNLFTGQPIFNQLLQLIPKHLIRELVHKHHADRYYKRFKSYEHLVTMLYACFHGCKSLREVTAGMMACSTRINHLGLHYMPRRSTLAEANANRSEQFFRDLYHRLYAHFYPEIVNGLGDTDGGGLGSDISCLVLFTQYEKMALERMVGAKRCAHILSSAKTTFMFC